MQSVILDMVNRFGYLGILILIAVENVFPPIPSEVILTFGGFLTTCTRLHPAGVVLASTAGSLLGALVLYGAGTLVSPEGLAELLESRPMKLLGFRAEDAWKTIDHVDQKGTPLPGHKGGRPWMNSNNQLPSADRAGNPISYREYDVSPNVKGTPRDAKRVVMGDDGSAYYTTDHYESFIEVRESPR